MSSDPSRKDPPRARGLWIGAGVLVSMGFLVGGGIVLHQRREIRRHLAAQGLELAELQLRANAIARESDELVQSHLLRALRQAHPDVDALARVEDDKLGLMFLHPASGGARGGHGFVVWSRDRTHGVVVVSPLPELGEHTAYHLVARSRPGGVPVTLTTFHQKTTVPFTLPQEFSLDRIEIVQAPESRADTGPAKVLLTSAEAQP